MKFLVAELRALATRLEPRDGDLLRMAASVIEAHDLPAPPAVRDSEQDVTQSETRPAQEAPHVHPE